MATGRVELKSRRRNRYQINFRGLPVKMFEFGQRIATETMRVLLWEKETMGRHILL